MKYFNNITTAEEIKKQFRAYCVSMHPDKGGAPEEFKKMMAEYNDILKNFGQAKKRAEEEEEARQEAEEARKEAEEERKRQEEEEREATEKMRPIIEKWAGILEAVPNKPGAVRDAAEYLAAVKRNIKAIFNKYFPGVKVSVLVSNKYWSAKTEIKWTDGPSVREVEAIKELSYFISTKHVSDPYSDYGDDVEIIYNKAWRKIYGEVNAQSFNFTRELSDLGKAEIFAKIAELLPQFAGLDPKKGEAVVNFQDVCKLRDFFHIDFNSDYGNRETCERLESSYFYDNITPLSSVFKVFRSFHIMSRETTEAAQAAAKAPKFTAKHNATYNAILKALGANVFCMPENGSYHYKEILIYEAAEMVAKGEKVYIGKPDMYDGERCIYGVNGGGAKVQQKRAEKFAAVGVTVSCYGRNSYRDVEILQFSANVLAELRKDAEEVEKQRKQWEEEQKNGKQTAHKADRSQKAAKSEKTAEGVDMYEAPADGLELVEIADGVAVVGDQHTTYKNRKQIKAHGARWNKEAQQWQATTPEAVAALREWFGMTEQGAQSEESTEAAAEPQSAADTAAVAATCEQVEAVGALASALSFLLNAVISASKEAKAAADQAAAKAAEAAAHDADAELKQKRKKAAAILREQIKKVSEQVANLSDTLAQMQERLNALESEQDASEEAAAEQQTGKTAQQGKATAQSRPKNGGGSGVDLSMLRAAAEDVERLTYANEHGRAALAELYALCACGVDVRDLIDELRELNTSEALGNKPAPEIWAKHSQIRRCARNRAKVVLSAEELRTLYTWDEGTEANNGKAA
nr:MAG TPA: Large polyvalent protein associated domain 29 [Caudoviricetes sp.]